MIIGIRADASALIGTGHVMRCLVLADELYSRGHDVIFFTLFDLGEKQIKEKGYNFIKINSFETNLEEDFFYNDKKKIRKDEENFYYALKQQNLDILIIDTYNVDAEYFINLKKILNKIIYIDDINAFSYPVDLVINGNESTKYMSYEKYYDYTKFLLGTEYTILRAEFRMISEKIIYNSNQEVMITTGGSDNYFVTEKILDAILSDDILSKLKINIVVGNAFTNIEKLLKIKENHNNVNLYWTYLQKKPCDKLISDSMSNIMLKSDIAFSSSGSTLYELCLCGCKILNFILSENQKEIASAMSEAGYTVNLGWYNFLTREKIITELKKILLEPNSIDIKREKSKRIGNGLGVKRIVDFIENQMNGCV